MEFASMREYLRSCGAVAILAEEWSSAKAVDEYLRFPSGIFIGWR